MVFEKDDSGRLRESSCQRRNFLKVVGGGIGLATTGVIGSAAAQNDPTPGAKEIGIDQKLRELFRNQEEEKAIALLDKYGIRYDTGSYPSETPDISPNYYPKGKSTINQNTYHNYGDVYVASLVCDLGGTSNPDGPGPDDGLGLTVGDDYWEPLMDTVALPSHVTLGKRGDLGIIGKYNDPKKHSEIDPAGWIEVQFKKSESGAHNIYGTWHHTWAPFNVPGGVTFGLAAGPISISKDISTDSWKLRDDVRL